MLRAAAYITVAAVLASLFPPAWPVLVFWLACELVARIGLAAGGETREE